MENVYFYWCIFIFNLMCFYCCCFCVGIELEKKLKKGRGLLKVYGNFKKFGSLGGVLCFVC